MREHVVSTLARVSASAALILCCVVHPSYAQDPGSDDTADHYALKRVAVMFRVTGNPVVRIQCSVFEGEYYTSKTVVWDPAERGGVTRYAVLPYVWNSQDDENKLTEFKVRCTSDRLDLDQGNGSLAYRFRSKTNNKQCTRTAIVDVENAPNDKEWKEISADDFIKLNDGNFYKFTGKELKRAEPPSPNSTKPQKTYQRPIVKRGDKFYVRESGQCDESAGYVDGSNAHFAGTKLSPIEITGQWVPLTPVDANYRMLDTPQEGHGSGDITISATILGEPDSNDVLKQFYSFEADTRLRSIDPTVVINDLLGTLATIALERAREASKSYVRTYLHDNLCAKLTVGELKRGLMKNEDEDKDKDKFASPIVAALLHVDWPDDRMLLQTTCRLLETMRIDELASARDAVWRAIAIDAADLGGAVVESALKQALPTKQDENEEIVRIVAASKDIMKSVILGNTATTERDLQVMILNLGRVGLKKLSNDIEKLPEEYWRCGLEVGMAILQECLQGDECTANELRRLLELELQLIEKQPQTHICTQKAVEHWPKLPTLLGRAADVLRPAPGVSPKMTAVTAFELVLDVAEHVILEHAKAELKRTEKDLKDAQAALDALHTKQKESKQALSAVETTVNDAVKNSDGKRSLDTTVVEALQEQFKKLKQSQQQEQDTREKWLEFAERTLEETRKGGGDPGNSEAIKKSEAKVTETLDTLSTKIEALPDKPDLQIIQTQLTELEKSRKSAQTEQDKLVKLVKKKEDSKTDEEKRAEERKQNAEAAFEEARRNVRKEYVLAMIQALRAVTATLRGEDPATTVAQLAAVIKKSVTDYCTQTVKDVHSKCKSPLTSAQLQRGLAVIAALASYGASYRSTSDSEDAAEVAKLRAEERKKALEEVIDAFTDRSQRRGEEVWSLGSNVSLGYQRSYNREKNSGDDIALEGSVNRNALSLPMGLAYQRLPQKDQLGGHVMLTVLDLSQYLTLSEDMKIPEPELTSALRLGIEAGLLWGEPNFPISLTLGIAWLPQVTYQDDAGQTGSYREVRVNGSIGIYVPFLDFN